MIAAGEEMLDRIFFFHPRAFFAPCSAALSLKGADWHPFDIALLGDED